MLRFVDGFDHYVTADLPKKWSSPTFCTIVSGGRTGNCLRSGNDNSLAKVLDPQATWIVGFAYKTDNGLSPSNTPLRFIDLVANVSHVDIQTNGSGQIRASRAGTLLGTGTTVLATGVWYHLQVKVTIHDTAGVVIVKVNGVTEINLSGIDTRNGSSAAADTLVLTTGGNGSVAPQYWDDFWVMDASGSVNNDFPTDGDLKVETLFPTGAGNSTQWTPSAGSNWQNVDEAAPNEDTDYNSSANPTDKDTFAMSDLSVASGSVVGLQTNIWGRKTDAGLRQIAAVVRSGGSESDGPTRSFAAGYLDYADVFETKPGGGSWLISDVNAMEAGVKLVA